MENGVSNKIIQFSFNLLNSNGADVNRIKNDIGISDYEIYKEGGRVNEVLYFKIINKTEKIIKNIITDGDSIIDSLTLNNMYNIFPNLFDYCTNSSLANEAIDKFIAFRTIIGDCDQLIKQDKGHETKLVYNNSIFNKELAGSAIPNFIIISNLIKCFVETKDIKVHFMGSPVFYWMDLNDFFGINCKWNQEQNSLTLNNVTLSNKNTIVNKYLESLQAENLTRLIANENSKGNLPSYIHDILAKK